MQLIKNIKRYPLVYGLLSVLFLWQVLAIIVDSSILPVPYEAVKSFIVLFPDTLWPHILVSLYRIFLALFFSLTIGVTVGLMTGLSPLVDALISPVVYILYPLPKVAFLPLFMIFLGIGDASKVLLMVSIITFQVLIAVRDGIKEIPESLFQSMTTLGLNKYQLYRHLIFPALLPRLFSAIRISLGISISSLFFAENFATTYGIGYFIMNAWSMVDYVKMFAGIISLSLIGVILFFCVDFIEKKVCPWNQKI